MDPAENSIYFSSLVPPALARYSSTDALAYFARIGLPPSTLGRAPSLQLLADLLLAHHLAVPYDTTALHVASWDGPSVPIEFGCGNGMQLGRGNFERIVLQHQGGYCFANNGSFSPLLRTLGFTVSQCGARVYMNRGKDPAEAGYNWSAITHETLLVGWPGSDERYLVDVGFGGGGCPYPILFKDGATSASLSKNESFMLRAERLPVDADDLFHPDTTAGYTLYRRVLPKGAVVGPPEAAGEGPGYWTPCYHFTGNTMCPTDIKMLNHYNETHPEAVWVSFLAVSRLLPSGARRTLSYGPGHREDRMAKLFTKEGISGHEEDIELVPLETGPIAEVLRREFGFKI